MPPVPAACCGPAAGATSLCHLGPGAGGFNSYLSARSWVTAARPPAPLTYTTGPAASWACTWHLLQPHCAPEPAVFNLWLPGVWCRRPCSLPLSTGARVQHPSRRHHQLTPQGRASSTCGCRGSRAGGFNVNLKHGGQGWNTPAAGVTNLCNRARCLQLVVAGGLAPAPCSSPFNTGGHGASPWLPASPTHATGPGVFNLWLPGVWRRRLHATLKHGGHGWSTPAAGFSNLCHRAGRIQLVVGPAAGATNLCNSIRGQLGLQRALATAHSVRQVLGARGVVPAHPTYP